MNNQLALALQLIHQAHLDNFCWGDNRLIKQQLEQSLQGNGERFIYIWGMQGCGKSHLLQGYCQANQASSVYLPLELLKNWGPESIEGIENYAFIALDNIDAIAGDKIWETALFHLYNRVRDNERTILFITSQLPPLAGAIQLPDLQSRLSWGLVLNLKELSDELKITTLQQQAYKRGFNLSSSVANFLIKRCERNMHNLQKAMDQLDQASLAAQRKITIPFVKSILGI